MASWAGRRAGDVVLLSATAVALAGRLVQPAAGVAWLSHSPGTHIASTPPCPPAPRPRCGRRASRSRRCTWSACCATPTT